MKLAEEVSEAAEATEEAEGEAEVSITKGQRFRKCLKGFKWVSDNLITQIAVF